MCTQNTHICRGAAAAGGAGRLERALQQPLRSLCAHVYAPRRGPRAAHLDGWRRLAGHAALWRRRHQLGRGAHHRRVRVRAGRTTLRSCAPLLCGCLEDPPLLCLHQMIASATHDSASANKPTTPGNARRAFYVSPRLPAPPRAQQHHLRAIGSLRPGAQAAGAAVPLLRRERHALCCAGYLRLAPDHQHRRRGELRAAHLRGAGAHPGLHGGGGGPRPRPAAPVGRARWQATFRGAQGQVEFARHGALDQRRWRR